MLRTVAFVSGVYDVLIGLAILTSATSLASLLGVYPPNPRVFGDLLALFLLVVGVGYFLPFRDPVRWRTYLWLMGPVLKGGGVLVFLRDYWMRGSPAGFLVFALTDGLLAVWTFVALVQEPRRGDLPAPPLASPKGALGPGAGGTSRGKRGEGDVVDLPPDGL